MKRHLLAASVACALSSATLPALAGEFRINNLYVLGDSLSDGGAYTATATQGLLANNVPAQAIPDRLSFTTNSADSKVWAGLLADRLGIAFDVDVINGLPANLQPNGGNYAQGGSRVSDPNGTGRDDAIGITTIPVTTQVDRLLADHPRLGSNDLVALWAGANDGFAQFTGLTTNNVNLQQAGQNMAIAANDLLTQIDRLKAAGAKNIVVITMPNLGVTPDAAAAETQFTGAKAILSGLTDAFNTTLITQAAKRGAVVVDSNQLLAAVIANPARYGFTAVNAVSVPACAGSSLTCVRGVNASPDSEQRLFADGVHPTAAAQRLFAQAGFAGLQAATINGVLAVAPLTPIRQHALSLENRLNSFALVHEQADGEVTLRPIGDVEYYGGVERGRFTSDAQQVQPGLTSHTTVVKFGADRMVTGNALVGAGMSVDQARTDIGQNGGNFKNDVYYGTAFTTIALSKMFYVNAAIAAGRIDYDITRQFQLGASTERYSSDTSASYQSFRAGGGSIHHLPHGWVVNPQLSFTHERIELDGYTEESGAASLSFGDTQYTAKRVSAGFALTKTPATLGGFRPVLRYSVEHDLNDDDITVRMGPNAQALATVSAPRPDRSFQLASLGVAKALGAGLISLHLDATLGQEGIDGTSIGLDYKAEF